MARRGNHGRQRRVPDRCRRRAWGIQWAIAPAAMGKQEALHRFSLDLTERARNGEMESHRGARRGDPTDRRHPDAPATEQPHPHRRGGVGKTAVVEGFAQRIASGDVPPPLRNVSLRALDIGWLPAGRCQYEGRIREPPAPGHRRGCSRQRNPSSCSSTRPTPLIGAGGAAGTGDAAQPAQAGPSPRQTAHHRGHHLGRVQEAHREGSGRSPRRFRVVQVGEPDEPRRCS